MTSHLFTSTFGQSCLLSILRWIMTKCHVNLFHSFQIALQAEHAFFALSSIDNDKMKLVMSWLGGKDISESGQNVVKMWKLVNSLFVCCNCAQTPLIGVSVSRVSQSERDRTTLVPGTRDPTQPHIRSEKAQTVRSCISQNGSFATAVSAG